MFEVGHDPAAVEARLDSARWGIAIARAIITGRLSRGGEPDNLRLNAPLALEIP
jgi:hypothetical protein